MEIRILDSRTAMDTILKRKPLGDGEIPPRILDRIKESFGEALTPLQAVQRIIADVRSRGDAGLSEWTLRLDEVVIKEFRVPSEEIESAVEQIPGQLLDDLKMAAQRVKTFHENQNFNSWMMEESKGKLGQLIRPIRRVGLYVPGGTAPLPSTLIMSAVPGRLAGVEQVAVVSPPGKNGRISPVILAAAAVSGVDEVYNLGGAQAIAALAYGTNQVPAVDKIFGPGNLFVTLAKREVFGTVGIDGLAGPTETVVIADDSARPDWVALDLLAQAEHDILAAAILLTPSRHLAQAVSEEITRLVDSEDTEPFSRAAIIQASLQAGSGIVLTRDLEEAFELSNAFAPEHLSLSIKDASCWLEKVQAAGGVFLGERSFEVLGDYAAGPSHVMPTGGTARFASPLNLFDFVRVISVVGLNPAIAREIASVSARLARAEGLDAHARAAEARCIDGEQINPERKRK